EPEDAERNRRPPIRAEDRPTRGRDERQRQEANCDTRERDAVRRHRVEAFGDEQKRRAPDETRDDKKEPVDHSFTITRQSRPKMVVFGALTMRDSHAARSPGTAGSRALSYAG